MPISTAEEHAEEIAELHVAWFLELIKPLLETHMVHGFKHGQKYEQQSAPKKTHH